MISCSVWGGLQSIENLSSLHEWCYDTHQPTIEEVLDKVSKTVGRYDRQQLGTKCL
jgi:hypothetical protein